MAQISEMAKLFYQIPDYLLKSEMDIEVMFIPHVMGRRCNADLAVRVRPVMIASGKKKEGAK